MSTELATTTNAPLPDKMQFAKALAEAGMIPKVYQRQPANVLVAIELGEALGIKAIVAINEINVINGTPSPSASLMASLARQAGHKVRITGDKESATCTIVRADDPDYEHTATWDVKKAKDAGLWGKGHWAKDPATMLKWRAISECVRFACSEVLGGLKYTPEEVAEFSTPQHVPSERVGSQRVPSRDGHVDAPAEPAATSMDSLAAAANTAPSYLDLDEFLARVNEATTVDALRAMWPMVAELEPEHRDDVKAIIQGRVQAIESDEAGQPTLDAEVVDSDGAA